MANISEHRTADKDHNISMANRQSISIDIHMLL